MQKTFAIGDIHGCCKTLVKLLEEINPSKEDELYFIGDYIDRGPDSKGVIDLILKLRDDGYSIYTLRGNHEQMMLDAFNGLEQFNHWLKNGGDVTLYSFPVPSLHSVESQYIDFIKQTEFYFETEKYIFVHAGLNFAHEDPFHDMNAMLWIRDFTVDRNKVKGKIIIHGHTPKPYNSIMSQLQLPDIAAIDLDGGCVYNYRADMGNLFAIDLTEMKFISVKNIDSSPAF